MTTLSIDLDEKTVARLENLAHAAHKDTISLIAQVLTAFADTDEARWAEYEQTGRGVAQDDAIAWLESLARGERQPCPR
ncbi:MAG TPA: hypothetical protein VI457_10720 [Methylococcaceae bacterium]|nr:hypothetical protein [Methylococcaceae bacterium]